MKLKTDFRTTLLLMIAGLIISLNSAAQITLSCTNPGLNIYGLTANGEIREINMTNATVGTVVKNGTYLGNSPSRANGMGYNIVNGRFYYFKRAVGTTPQEFVSFNPLLGAVSVLAPSTCAQEVHTGCINFAGTGYYTVDVAGNLNYYNILLNTWTFITSNIRDQNGTDVDSVIRAQDAGDMAMDGWGNIWLVTSSNSNYGLYQIPSPPTTAVAQLNVIRVVSPTTSTPTGQSFAGIAFNPSGQIFMATKNGNRLYRLNSNLSLSFIGTMTVSDIGNDLTSCSFPFLVLPVSWKNFDVNLQKNNNVGLSWEVGEDHNKGFYVQHSLDGTNWEDLVFISSKNNTESISSYSYSHTNNFNGKQYYRIKQENQDGKTSYSDVRTITLKNSSPVSIWPNPTTDVIRIATQSGDNSSFVKAQVYDLSGRMITQKQLQPASLNTINISSLPAGTYLVRVENNNGGFFNQKISKQ
jgi:hypothetical protein